MIKEISSPLILKSFNFVIIEEKTDGRPSVFLLCLQVQNLDICAVVMRRYLPMGNPFSVVGDCHALPCGKARNDEDF